MLALKMPFYLSGWGDKRRRKSISIPTTPVYSSTASAICSSPAVRLNYTSPNGSLQMVHNSGLPKHIIMYTADPPHLQIIAVHGARVCREVHLDS